MKMKNDELLNAFLGAVENENGDQILRIMKELYTRRMVISNIWLETLIVHLTGMRHLITEPLHEARRKLYRKIATERDKDVFRYVGSVLSSNELQEEAMFTFGIPLIPRNKLTGALIEKIQLEKEKNRIMFENIDKGGPSEDDIPYDF